MTSIVTDHDQSSSQHKHLSSFDTIRGFEKEARPFGAYFALRLIEHSLHTMSGMGHEGHAEVILLSDSAQQCLDPFRFILKAFLIYLYVISVPCSPHSA